MAFGWDQRQRLLREYWTAPGLAEEIFAMMSPDVPNNTKAPINVNLPDGSQVAPLQIGNYTPGDPYASFFGKHGQLLGSLSFDEGDLNIIQPDGKKVPIGSGGSKQKPPVVTSEGKTYPGFITGGSGDTYTADIYKAGYPGASTSVLVKQLQISTDTIPAGTAAMITQGPSETYTMQVPVWVG